MPSCCRWRGGQAIGLLWHFACIRTACAIGAGFLVGKGGLGRAPLGPPDEELAVEIGRNVQCTDQFAAKVFDSLVIEAEYPFYPARGDAALGDEAPEGLFQDLLKVHGSAPLAATYVAP